MTQNKEVKIKNLPRVNTEIRTEKVKLVDENRQYMGIFDTSIALRIARERGLDLVEVSPEAQPPVCRLMNFGRYVYEKKRQERESRKHQHQTQVREMRMSMKISDHDYQVKMNKIKEFLEKGDRVKVKLRLRGRELIHAHLGMNLVERVIKDLESIAKEEAPPKQEEQIISVTLIPQRVKKESKQ
ncbi:MAG: translation initiation factor IF-3 [candidate division WOR-3 bacterium]